MIKTFFKFLLCVVVYTLAYLIASALMPYSEGFKELNAAGIPANSLLFMLINAVWVCFTIYFLVRNSQYGGKKLFTRIVFILFFVQSFMTQIETLLFGGAFPVLTKPDIILIMLASLCPLFAAVPLQIKFFQNKPDENTIIESGKILTKSIFIKLGIIGIVYMCVYMLFGYYVAWQFEALRIFYTGSPEKLGFWGQMANNSRLMLFQIMRGILFGVFVLPLINMLIKNKRVFITGVCLVYLCAAVLLILPNPLFPDTVRMAHLIEMTSSMLLFGIIVGNILQRPGGTSYDSLLNS